MRTCVGRPCTKRFESPTTPASSTSCAKAKRAGCRSAAPLKRSGSSPPVALLSDANLVAAMVDTTILVIGAATTPYPLVRRAVESVGASRILGIVLNRIDRGQMVGGYGFYDYYGYGTRDDTARKAEKADIAREAAMDAA